MFVKAEAGSAERYVAWDQADGGEDWEEATRKPSLGIVPLSLLTYAKMTSSFEADF